MAYDPNEARDQRGRWEAGGSGDDVVKVDRASPSIEVAQEDARRIGIRARAVAENLHFDPAHISVTTDDRLFDLNGHHYHYAGSADLQSGEITLYQPNITPDAIDGVTAHEITHEKYETFLKAYRDEFDKVMAEPEPLEAAHDRTKLVMRADGLLNPPYDQKFPVYQEYTKLMMPGIYQYQKTDGVSDYSRQWWKAAEDGKATTKQAFHETISEIGQQHYKSGIINGAPEWRDLYKAVLRHWEKRK